MKGQVLGIDIGGTNTKYALVDSDGKMEEIRQFKTHADRPFEEFLSNLTLELQSYLSNKSLEIKDLKAGFGIPNYSFVKNKLINPPNLSWGEQDIFSMLNKIFPKGLYIDNDANLAALGEKVWGKAVHSSDFVCITVGTGIGSGIYTEGKLLRGPAGIAAEAGHIIISPEGRSCNCGGKGHFESYCSVTGIKKSVAETFQENLSYHEIKKLLEEDNKKIVSIFQKTAKYFAIGLEQISALFSPQKIILSGGGMAVGEKFRLMIEQEFQKIAYGPNLELTTIETSDLCITNGAILGAAALVYYEEN